MLGVLRKNSKHWLVITLVGIGVFGMAFFFGASNEKTTLPTWAAKVEGETISLRALNNIYAMQVDRIKSQYPEIDEKMLENLNYKEKILSDLVLNKLLSINAKKIGFIVSDEELKDTIINTSMFHKNNKFDLDYYKGFLAYSGYSSSEFENSFKSDALNVKLKELISESVKISDKELELFYIMENEKLNIDIVELKIDENLIKIKDDDIDNYLKTEAGMKKVKTYYVDNNEKYKEKEKVRARHILSKIEQNFTLEQKLDKKKKLEELLSIINIDNFSELASIHSDDGSKVNGGDLNYFTRGQMVKPFEDTAFSLNVGEISNIIETEFGYHIILVDDKKPERIVNFEEVKNEIALNFFKEEEKNRIKNEKINSTLNIKNLNKALLSIGQIETSEFFSRASSSINKIPGSNSKDIDYLFSLDRNKLYHTNIGNKDYIFYIKEFQKADLDSQTFKDFKISYLDRIKNEFYTKYSEELRIKFADKIKYSPALSNLSLNKDI